MKKPTVSFPVKYEQHCWARVLDPSVSLWVLFKLWSPAMAGTSLSMATQRGPKGFQALFAPKTYSVQLQLVPALICMARHAVLSEQITHHLSPQISNQQHIIAFNYWSAYLRNYSTYIMDTWRHKHNHSWHSSDNLSHNNYLSGGEDSRCCESAAGKCISHQHGTH